MNKHAFWAKKVVEKKSIPLRRNNPSKVMNDLE